MPNYTVELPWRDAFRLALCASSRLPADHDHTQCRHSADRAIATCHDTIDGQPDLIQPAA